MSSSQEPTSEPATSHDGSRAGGGANAVQQTFTRMIQSPGLPIALVDIGAVAVFALLARIAHQSETMPLNFGGWFSSFWPFLIGLALGWAILVAQHWETRARLPIMGLIIWGPTALGGLIIWTIRNAALPHWSFIVVATLMTGALLFGWRCVDRAFVLRAAKRKRNV